MTFKTNSIFISVAVIATALVGCSSQDETKPAEPTTIALGQRLSEAATISPRIVISHENGLLTLDEKTKKPLNEYNVPGFYRLAGAGDGRHVMVTDGNQFKIFDAGISSQPHGDHSHNFRGEPGLTDAAVSADHAGHVVVHGDTTALFADGTGDIQLFKNAELEKGMPKLTTFSAGEAHHGVAVPLSDGTFLTTKGNEKDRHTIVHTDGQKELAKTEDCPNIHGEAAAQGDTVVFGCTNGPVIFRDGQFHKVAAKVPYQRNGNLAGSPASPIVLGDEKLDKEAKQERPTKVALINSETGEYRSIDLGSSYWFRSLARGPHGEALVLTYDGSVHIIDATTGETKHKVNAIEAWEEKEKWQEPGPILKVAGDKAYVSDAKNKKITVIDIASGKVEDEIQLEVEPVEMEIVTGEASHPHEHGHSH